MLNFTELAQLQIPHHKSGRPVMGFGMEVSFAVRNGDTPNKRLAVTEMLGQIQNTFPQHVTAFMKENSNRLTTIKEDNFLKYYRKLIATSGEDSAFGPILTSRGKIPPVTAYALLGKSRNDGLNTIRAHAPLDWFADNSDQWVSMVLDWCNRIKPVKGVAGISPIAEFAMLRSRFHEYWPFLARYPGLLFYLPFSGSTAKHNSIGDVNWLTVLNDSIVDELGGLEALTKALGEGIIVHKWDGGILIQAGQFPELGDVSKDLWPLKYCQVNDATKALRFEDYRNTPMALIRVPPPFDAYEETYKWISRFDSKV